MNEIRYNVIKEFYNFEVTSNGEIITGSLYPENGQQYLTLTSSDGISTFATEQPVKIALTPGTDTNPHINYAYILDSTNALTVSISGWPEEKHWKIAQVYLHSAAIDLKYSMIMYNANSMPKILGD